MEKKKVKNYLDLMRDVLENGEDRPDRTGTGTRSIFGRTLRFNLKEGFPAVTTKKLLWKSVVSELVWFIEGSCDERRLCELHHGVRDPSKKTIWTENANADYWKPKAKFEGDLGRVYGVSWRYFRSVNDDGTISETDQLKNLIEGLKNDPYGRRHIVNAWNAGEIGKGQMALPPCHVMFQFNVGKKGLSCIMTQRSGDVFLGVNFNFSSYALLTHLVAKTIGLEVDELILNIADTHIYSNHFDAVATQLQREPFPLPTLDISEVKDIWTATVDQCKLVNYRHHPAIFAKMAV